MKNCKFCFLTLAIDGHCEIHAEGRGTGCHGTGQDRDMRRDRSSEEN